MLAERLRNARLSESRRRREENDLTIAFSHIVPTAPQQTNLFAAADERRQALDNAGFESSPRPAFANDPPQPRRTGNSLEFVQPEVFVVEGGAGETYESIPRPQPSLETPQPESLRPDSMSRRQPRVPGRCPRRSTRRPPPSRWRCRP